MVTGGFFGITIDITKISNPDFIEYVFASIAFVTGYSVRHIIQIISNIIETILSHDTKDKQKDEDETSNSWDL